GGERLHGGPAGAIRALAGPEGPQRRLPAPRARRGEGGAEPRLEAGRGAAGALHRPAPDGRALPRDGHPRAARRPAERADARSPADVLPDPPGHRVPRRRRPRPAALPDRPPAPAGEAQPARPAPDEEIPGHGAAGARARPAPGRDPGALFRPLAGAEGRQREDDLAQGGESGGPAGVPAQGAP